MNQDGIKTAALYIRVSTDKQEELSPDSQKKLLKEYAKKNHYITSEEFTFMDNGISGRKAEKRPQFQKMIGYAKSKEHPFDAILVWKFSRFARNQEESIVYKNMLKKDGVEVVSISEPLIDGPFGDLIERIIEWMDEYYSIRLSGEVIRGMTESVERGRYVTTAPFGYDCSKEVKGLLVINEEEAAIVREIFDRYIHGIGTSALARQLNIRGIRTKRGNTIDNRGIARIIQNPVYYGYFVWNGKYQKGIHEPIITKEVYDQANEIIAIHKRKPRKSRPAAEYNHFLSSLIKCSSCGASLSCSTNGYFQCINYNHGKCHDSHHVSEKKIVEALYESLEHVLADDGTEYIAVVPKEDKSMELKELQAALSSLSNKEKRIKEAYINEIDTLEEYRTNRNMLQRERERIQSEIDAIRKELAEGANLEQYRESVKNVYDFIRSDKVDHRKKNLALRSIIDKIVYNKVEQKVTVHYYIS